MNNHFPNSIQKPSNIFTYEISTVTPFQITHIQSPSVTPSGSLWQNSLLRISLENSFTVLQSISTSHTSTQNNTQTTNDNEVLRLLRSWREGDEEEQRDTWEYLKQALDEDRFSERKLFP